MPAPSSDRRRVAAQISAYVTALPPDSRREVKALRATIRAAAPGAVEHFSYGIPGFRLDDKPLLWYAGAKTHTSMYPVTAAMKRASAAQVRKYQKGKGTLHFPLDATPLALVTRLAKARAKEIRAAR